MLTHTHHYCPTLSSHVAHGLAHTHTPLAEQCRSWGNFTKLSPPNCNHVFHESTTTSEREIFQATLHKKTQTHARLLPCKAEVDLDVGRKQIRQNSALDEPKVCAKYVWTFGPCDWVNACTGRRGSNLRCAASLCAASRCASSRTTSL